MSAATHQQNSSRRPAMALPTEVLTVVEVARKLRVTEQHVSDLIEEGQLQAIDVGSGSRRHWRIPREAYELFKASNHSHSPAKVLGATTLFKGRF